MARSEPVNRTLDAMSDSPGDLPARGPGRPRSDRARRAILDATTSLMREQGLHGVTIEQIARRAGVSKATIYKWWPDRTAVALEAFGEVMASDVRIPDTGSARNDFTRELTSVMLFYTSDVGRPFIELLAQARGDASQLAEFRARFLSSRREVVRTIWERGVERGELRAAIDPEIAMDVIYGPAIFRLLTGHGPLCARVADQIVTAAIDGLGVSPSPDP